MTNAAPTRKQAAREREESAPYVDEVTARGVGREEMSTQTPTAPLDAPAGVSEIKPGYMTLYKRVEYGWKPTIVARGSVEACVETGAFRFECGDCGEHCGRNGPNDCTGREPMKFTRCPVQSCRKPLYDTTEADDPTAAPEENDPNEIKLIATASTPEARLRVKLNRHLRFAHLSTAEEMGVGADPFLVPNAAAIANAMQPAVPFPVHPAERA